jgi:anaerobic magnesium-protoporphyrin IX monomethyl ester cyclase
VLILYNPPSSAQRKPILPMSLLALGALLEGQHDYRIVDGNLEDAPLAALDRAICETGADILGVTVMPGPQLNVAVPTCQALKARHPGLLIVWGGYFPTQHWEACLRADYVDYVVRGHGEIVFQDPTSPCWRDEAPSTPELARIPWGGQRRAGSVRALTLNRSVN